MTTFTGSLRAAEVAERATLWGEAARRYEEALSLLAGGGGGAADEAALLTALGRCYWNLSDVRAAWRTLRRAMSLYEERGDGVGLARATVEILRIWGPPDKQRAMAERALDALGDGDLRLRAHLLLRLERPEEALRIADEYGFGEVQAARYERAGWEAMRAGRLDEGIEALRAAHVAFAANGALHPAAGTLRGAGFNVLASGRLDQGAQLAEEAMLYAGGVHLKFQEDLARLDLAGVAFARCDLPHCGDLIAPSLGGTDFRADAYRMWMIEQRGDTPAALSLVIEPSRAG
ncbi:MAG TPA: hypothetical protein VET66_10080, partial [Steroidobacteraceae bacterium]|nr:hypothetical protein [Steroidobacteraceae bacterium]